MAPAACGRASAAIAAGGRQNGCANADVRDQAAAEERADAPLGAIEELIGHHDVERLVLLLQAADGARREDALDAEHLEAEDVRAEVQLGRQQPMADAVPRQERDALAAQRADHVRARRIAERRRDARSSRSVSSAMSYRPLPPMMPIAARVMPADRLHISFAAGFSDDSPPPPRDRARRRPGYSRSTDFPQKSALEFERVHRIQVEAHDPRVGRGARSSASGRRRTPRSCLRIRCRRSDGHRCGRRCARTRTPGIWRSSLAKEIHDAGLGQRRQVVRQVAGAVALVRMRGIVPFAVADDTGRAGNDGTSAPDESRRVKPPA